MSREVGIKRERGVGDLIRDVQQSFLENAMPCRQASIILSLERQMRPSQGDPPFTSRPMDPDTAQQMASGSGMQNFSQSGSIPARAEQSFMSGLTGPDAPGNLHGQSNDGLQVSGSQSFPHGHAQIPSGTGMQTYPSSINNLRDAEVSMIFSEWSQKFVGTPAPFTLTHSFQLVFKYCCCNTIYAVRRFGHPNDDPFIIQEAEENGAYLQGWGPSLAYKGSHLPLLAKHSTYSMSFTAPFQSEKAFTVACRRIRVLCKFLHPRVLLCLMSLAKCSQVFQVCPSQRNAYDQNSETETKFQASLVFSSTS